ncbi:hypothetical protein A0J61_11846 [Choanephora cucurbitarum]|uniref:Uncharacterized protein n=1 Tax=Choanephora cucurbitarum TaxID=101091 RepID=A0A1C7MT90_9FUNG|nr:hypothetical protein A0J61_11846 [Choanephora cucurbitarum]
MTNELFFTIVYNGINHFCIFGVCFPPTLQVEGPPRKTRKLLSTASPPVQRYSGSGNARAHLAQLLGPKVSEFATH